MLSSGAYLGSKLKSIDILLSCPATDMLFMKINATLLSSAADEKLFSALNGRWCRMSDEILSQHNFLRSQFNVPEERYADKHKTNMA